MGYNFESLSWYKGEDFTDVCDKAISDYQCPQKLKGTQVENIINLEDFPDCGNVVYEAPYQLDPAFLHFILLNCYKKIRSFLEDDHKFLYGELTRENPRYFFQGENNLSITIEYKENKMLFLAGTKKSKKFIQKVKERVFENKENIELSSKYLAVAEIADRQVMRGSFQRLIETKSDQIYNSQGYKNGKSYDFEGFKVTCYNNGTVLTQGGMLLHEEYFSLQTFWLAVLEKGSL